MKSDQVVSPKPGEAWYVHFGKSKKVHFIKIVKVKGLLTFYKIADVAGSKLHPVLSDEVVYIQRP